MMNKQAEAVEQLADLKDSLEVRDPETLEYLGIEDDGTEGNQTLGLRKKL